MVQLAGVGLYGQQGSHICCIPTPCHDVLASLRHNLTVRTISDESIDVDPNYDPSDFLKLASHIKVERPDHDMQPHHDDDEQQHHAYDEQHQTYEQLQPHNVKDEMNAYEMHPQDSTQIQQQYANEDDDEHHHQVYDGQLMYQQQQPQQHVILDGEQQQQQFMVYDDEQAQYGQLQTHAAMNVSDNTIYQNMDAGGQVLHQMQQQQQHPDDMGVGIDDDLAVSDSDDEEVLNVGNAPERFDTTEPEPPVQQPQPPAVAVAAKQETQMDIDPDDDGGDLWF